MVASAVSRVEGQHDRLDAPGRRLEHDGIPHAGDPQRVLDVLGIHVEAIGQHDHVLDPAAEDEPARRVEVARSPVRYQPSSVNAAAVSSGAFQ